MFSKFISRKTSQGQIVLYRRVSTTTQARKEYKSQLRSIRNKYPGFTIEHSTIIGIAENISGRAEPELRMASGLGKALRELKRHPSAILLVSNADRIARRPDIFRLIHDQGFGLRVFDAETGMSLDDMISSGKHLEIEKRTENNRRAQQDGRDRYKASGGVLGSSEIRSYSRQGTRAKKRLTKARQDDVLGVVAEMTRQNRGHKPSFKAICDELDLREIRTGQGRFFNPERLRQYRKQNRGKWLAAMDSYARPRRRIRQIVTTALVQVRKQCAGSRIARRFATTDRRDFEAHNPTLADNMLLVRPTTRPAHQFHKCCRRDGCSAPPDATDAAHGTGR